MKYRKTILLFLIIVVFLSFTISYAINNIALFLLLGLFFYDSSNNIKSKCKIIFKDRLIIGYMLFFIMQFISLLYSSDLQEGIRRVTVLIPLLFVPAVLRTEPLDNKQVKTVIDIIKISIPITFLTLLGYHLFFLDKALNTFVHFTIHEKIGVSQFYLAFILMIPIIDCLRYIVLGHKMAVNVFLLALNLSIIFLLGNKTVLVFLLILGIVLSINVFRSNKKKGVLLMVISIVSIVGASQLTIVQNRMNVFFKTTDFDFETIETKNRYTITKNTVEHRFLIDYIALKAIKTGLPFGYGIGDYQNVLYEGYKQLKFKAGMHYKYNAHNQYFSEFLKSGFLGGIIFIALMLGLLKHIKTSDYFTFIILFFALGCCFESYLFRQHGVVIFSFILPFIIYNTQKLNQL